mgnify:CR=1 FL=1
MLIELAFIKLTKPEMEQSMDSVLERLEKLERMVEEMSAGGYVPVQTAGMDGEPMINAGQQIPPQAYAQPVYSGAGAPGNGMVPSGSRHRIRQICRTSKVRARIMSRGRIPAESPAGRSQHDRNEWGKIVRDMGMSIRPSFRETVVEPAGDSCLCIVFNDPMNFAIGSRPSVLGDLERYVEQKYGKSLYFKSRVRESGERMDTRYISDDELRENIHMDITIED